MRGRGAALVCIEGANHWACGGDLLGARDLFGAEGMCMRYDAGTTLHEQKRGTDRGDLPVPSGSHEPRSFDLTECPSTGAIYCTDTCGRKRASLASDNDRDMEVRETTPRGEPADDTQRSVVRQARVIPAEVDCVRV